MKRLRELSRRLLFLLRRRRFDRDLEREMQIHLEMQAEAQRASGVDPEEAAYAARREFGNAAHLREASREVWGWGWLERLEQDVRSALRTMRRNRGFAVVAVTVLALGIGGNTAIFTLANALVLNPFPYPDADRLVGIDVRSDGGSWYSSVPVGDFFVWRTRTRTLQDLAAYGTSRVTVAGAPSDGFDGPVRLVAGTATASFLRVLGVRPERGRFFTDAEERPGAAGVVLLSHGTWMRRFGGREDVLGRALVINDRPHAIIGIMPARLPLPGSPPCDLWLPTAYGTAFADTTRWDGDQMVARLRPGVTEAQAEAEFRAIRRQREREDGALRAGLTARVRPIGGDIAEYARPAVRALAAAVGFVLLLACANLAGLLLARAAARSHEIAIRAALGAGRWRLMRQMLVESVLLSLCGGTLGLVVAGWGIAALPSAAPRHLGLEGALRLDEPVLLFTVAVSVFTGLVFGLVPAVHASSPRLTGVLQGSRVTVGSRRSRRTLALLVITEIALALVLLTGGGLMMKSFVGLLRVDIGVRADHLLTFEIALPRARYDQAPKVTDLYRALLERLRATPGVVRAALVNPLPMSGQFSGSGFQIDNRAPDQVSGRVSAQYLSASPGYFATAGIPVVAGREFTDADRMGAPPVVIVNQAFARLHLPNDDPLAHTVNGARIVGVVGDIRHSGPARPPNAQIYNALAQRPSPWFAVTVRTTGNPGALGQSIRAAVLATDRTLPLDRVRSMQQVVSESLAESRMTSGTVFGFAVFALILAAVGVYGVIAFSVGERTHEFGVRLALGASPNGVVRLVFAQGVRLGVAGALIGIPAAFATSRLLRSLLVGVSPRDPVVLILVPLVLLAVTLLASYLPARRATRIDPLDALRCE